MKNLMFIMNKFVKRNTLITKVLRNYAHILRRKSERKAYDYINENYKHLFEKYNDLNILPTGRGEGEYPVWVCWFQGEENMPEIIKMCYASLLKNSNRHKINLITYNNYSKFVNIPEYIIEKHKRGIISPTHFSDVLRACLLSEYGGLWIDASIYVSGKLPSFDRLSFWTGKWTNGGEYSERTLYTDFLSYCLTDNVLWSFLKEFYIDYWNKNNKVISYFILSVAMQCAYENIKTVKHLIDNVSSTSRGMYSLYPILNSEFDEKEYESLCKEICFHKLTYKEDFRKYTKGKKLTFYGYLCQQWEREKSTRII